MLYLYVLRFIKKYFIKTNLKSILSKTNNCL